MRAEFLSTVGAFWKGRIGQTAVSWSKYEGGALRIGTDGADRGDGLAAVKLRARDQGHVWEIASDHGRVPPFYASRWPTGMQQWIGQMGWNCAGEKAGVNARLDPVGPRVRLAWQQGASEQELRLGATLVASLTEDLEQLGCRMAAVQQPLNPEVHGGDFRCYTEEDGTYEIGQGDPTRVEIVFPPDPLQRPARHRRVEQSQQRKTGLRAGSVQLRRAPADPA